MFKEIIDAFRREEAIPELLHLFDEMLEKGEWIFNHTDPEQLTASNVEQIADDIYAADKRINKLERKIRYRILGHLTVNPSGDASLCMTLMVVSKDAERIGDYCKNIFEVLLYCGPSRYASMHTGVFREMRQLVNEMLPVTRKAFQQNDVMAAEVVIKRAGTIGKEADFIVQQVLESTGASNPEGAAHVLLARHYKRIGAHLSNICTAVTSPVDMLGYHDEPRSHRKD